MENKTDASVMTLHVARLEEAAQDAEDRDQSGRASKFRAQARELQARIAALVSAEVR